MKVRRVVVIGAALLGFGVAGAVAAPAAQAFTYAPAPGGGTVVLNRGEAAAVGNANVAGAVDAVLPGHRSVTGESLGHGVNRLADYVGRTPGSSLQITVHGAPADPRFYMQAR